MKIVEVGLRDGFQSLARVVPTARKIELLHDLQKAAGHSQTGIRRIYDKWMDNGALLHRLAVRVLNSHE